MVKLGCTCGYKRPLRKYTDYGFYEECWNCGGLLFLVDQKYIDVIIEEPTKYEVKKQNGENKK